MEHRVIIDKQEDIIGAQEIFQSQDPSEAIKETARGLNLRNAPTRVGNHKETRPSILQIKSRKTIKQRSKNIKLNRDKSIPYYQGRDQKNKVNVVTYQPPDIT